MTTFSASVRIDDGTLHVSRPLTAPEPVGDLIDSAVYTLTSGTASGVLSIDMTIEAAGESQTPIGDSITGTSSTPINASAGLDNDEDEPAVVPSGVLA